MCKGLGSPGGKAGQSPSRMRHLVTHGPQEEHSAYREEDVTTRSWGAQQHKSHAQSKDATRKSLPHPYLSRTSHSGQGSAIWGLVLSRCPRQGCGAAALVFFPVSWAGLATALVMWIALPSSP